MKQFHLVAFSYKFLNHSITMLEHTYIKILMEKKRLELETIPAICIVIAVLLLEWIKSSESAAVSPSGPDRKGNWQLLLNDTGVVGSQMVLTHHNTVIMVDRTTTLGRNGYSLSRRSNGTSCKGGSADSSCYAHSVEYNIRSNKIRPLNIQSNSWSSSGSVLSNGTIIQTGGLSDGFRKIRVFEPCKDRNCDWKQTRKRLSDNRSYASNLLLPDHDRVIVLGGRSTFTYEFVPKLSANEKSFDLLFLRETHESDQGGNNLYPFLHLSSDGNLFIFANRDSILFNYIENRVVKTFPRIPGNGSRSYPSSGSSVVLPLDHSDGYNRVEVMVCGGAASGAVTAAAQSKFLNGLMSCGRMVITGNNHKWDIENMPGPRLMNDMILLPTGNILIINGARRGCAGDKNAVDPSLHPYLYRQHKKFGTRFSVLKSTQIARMYQSSAALLPDGRVLVAGSNPNNEYLFSTVRYPTELRLQAFAPGYTNRKLDHRRPHNVSIYSNGKDSIGYGEEFGVQFMLQKIRMPKNVEFSAYAPPFTTHSISMNQRLLMLRCKELVRGEDGWVNALLEAPPSANVAPAGYYMLSVVHDGIPSLSHWVKFMHS